MRIVDIAEFYSEGGGGVRTYIHQKLEHGSALGVEVTVIAPGEEDRIEERSGGRIVWVRSPAMPFDSNYRRFAFAGGRRAVTEVLDGLRPQVVEASSTWQGGWIAADWRGSALKALFLHQDPVAVYPQALLDERFTPEQIDRAFTWFWRYLDRLSRAFDTAVVSGAWLSDKLVRLGLRRFASVPLGVDKARFAAARPDLALRREMLAACGIDPDRPDAALAAAVSRHHPEKRIPTLIAAAERLGRGRPFGLYLIGDGPDRQTVERLAARVPGVFVAGVERDRDRLAARLASADFFLHGGAAETFGLAVAEALAAGLPLVTPDAGGAGELVDPAWGERYRAGDAEGCVAAVERLLARDPTALRKAARDAAERIASPREHFERLFGHYGEALAHRDERAAAQAVLRYRRLAGAGEALAGAAAGE